MTSDRRPRRPNDHAGGGEQATGSPGRDRHRPPLPTRVDSLPDLPAAYERALDAGLAAIPLALDARARSAISAHVRLLLAWNEAINLTAIVEPEAVARLHVLDSLAAVPLLLERRPAGERLRIVDLGSGGGFPGLPLAAAIPDADVLLVDSVAKKVRFLDAAVDATGLGGSGLGPSERAGRRVRTRAIRGEQLAEEVRTGREAPFDVVTARAVGSLPDLLELGFPLLAIGGTLLAWKRGDLADELEAARRAASVLGGGDVAIHDVRVPGLEGHRIVAATKWAATPPGYPRDPGRRARARW